MTPYSCPMDDGQLLQVSVGSFSYAPNPRSRKSRMDAVINFCAALAALLLGLLFSYIGLVMFISFFTKEHHDTYNLACHHVLLATYKPAVGPSSSFIGICSMTRLVASCNAWVMEIFW